MQADISGYPLRKRSLDYGDPLPNVTVMLGRISLQTLQKAAVYGAVLSVAGSSILYYLTQSKKHYSLLYGVHMIVSV